MTVPSRAVAALVLAVAALSGCGSGGSDESAPSKYQAPTLATASPAASAQTSKPPQVVGDYVGMSVDEVDTGPSPWSYYDFAPDRYPYTKGDIEGAWIVCWQSPKPGERVPATGGLELFVAPKCELPLTP